MNDSPHNPQVSIPPAEDARLPVLEAEIEREWRAHRKGMVRILQAEGLLQTVIKEKALDCVRVLQEAQNRGLSPDQGRELMRALILPQD